jgi:3-carboxy-cis,cis-muconate cycloisomerase
MTFQALFVPQDLRDAVSDEAWLQGMLDAEAALARASARVSLIPVDAASAISAACRRDLYDIEEIALAGRSTGNPTVPLVKALREIVGGSAARFVHWGATSQDIVDTAAMLVARRSLALVLAQLDRAVGECARLAKKHRETPMVARTLLQPAVPTTFGAKASGWLVAALDARERLRHVNNERLAAQLGGAAGTLAAFGDHGLEVSRLYAEEVGLPEAPLPWHGSRGRVADLGQSLAEVSGVMAKIGLDIALLSQVEVGEIHEPLGKGGSSTMPHKRNPVGSVLASACARHVRAYADILVEAMVLEHERAVGAWQSEWGALSGALGLTGGGTDAIADSLGGLIVDTARMRANLETHKALVMSEAASLSAGTHDADLLDPLAYLGSAGEFVDRALAWWGEEN